MENSWPPFFLFVLGNLSSSLFVYSFTSSLKAVSILRHMENTVQVGNISYLIIECFLRGWVWLLDTGQLPRWPFHLFQNFAFSCQFCDPPAILKLRPEITMTNLMLNNISFLSYYLCLSLISKEHQGGLFVTQDTNVVTLPGVFVLPPSWVIALENRQTSLFLILFCFSFCQTMWLLRGNVFLSEEIRNTTLRI